MVPLKTIMVIIAELLSLESYIHVTPVTSRKKKEQGKFVNLSLNNNVYGNSRYQKDIFF